MAVAKIKYATEATITCDVASLASDTSLLAGRAGTAVSNATDLFDDVLISGKIAANTGAAPTANTTIEVWAYAQINDTPTYPDSITGTDANKTMTSANVKSAALRLLWAAVVDAATSRVYSMPPTSLADRFGAMPKRWGIFVVQNSAQALAASGSEFKMMGVNYESV